MGRHRNYGGSGPITPEATDAMLQLNRTLTAADILALNMTDFELVPAPGLGRILTPTSISAKLTYGGTAYLLGADIHLFLGPSSLGNDLGAMISAALIRNNADVSQVGPDAFPAVQSGSPANIANQPLTLSTITAFTTGNSTLTITIFYGVAPTG